MRRPRQNAVNYLLDQCSGMGGGGMGAVAAGSGPNRQGLFSLRACATACRPRLPSPLDPLSLTPRPHRRRPVPLPLPLPPDPCTITATGPLLPRLTACAPRASAAQHHALDTLLDASPPNPGTDVNEPEAALDTPGVPARRRARALLDDGGDGKDGGDDDGDDDEYDECGDGDKDCEEVEVED